MTNISLSLSLSRAGWSYVSLSTFCSLLSLLSTLSLSYAHYVVLFDDDIAMHCISISDDTVFVAFSQQHKNSQKPKYMHRHRLLFPRHHGRHAKKIAAAQLLSHRAACCGRRD